MTLVISESEVPYLVALREREGERERECVWVMLTTVSFCYPDWNWPEEWCRLNSRLFYLLLMPVPHIYVFDLAISIMVAYLCMLFLFAMLPIGWQWCMYPILVYFISTYFYLQCHFSIILAEHRNKTLVEFYHISNIECIYKEDLFVHITLKCLGYSIGLKYFLTRIVLLALCLGFRYFAWMLSCPSRVIYPCRWPPLLW